MFGTERKLFLIHPTVFLHDITQSNGVDTFHNYQLISINDQHQVKISSCDAWNSELHNRNYLKIENSYYDPFHHRVFLLFKRLVKPNTEGISFLGTGCSCTYIGKQRIEFVSDLFSFPIQKEQTTTFPLSFSNATQISLVNKPFKARQILGLINGCLVLSADYSQTNVIMEASDGSHQFTVIDDIVLSQDTKTSPWILPLPNNKSGLVLGNQANLFDETRQKFDSTIPIIEEATNQPATLSACWHSQSHYDHFDAHDKYAPLQNGYELIVTETGLCWQLYYNQDENKIYKSFLKWMPDPSKCCSIIEIEGIFLGLNGKLIHRESQSEFEFVIYFPKTKEFIPLRNEESRTKKQKLTFSTLDISFDSVVEVFPSNRGVVIVDNSNQVHLIPLSKLKEATKIPLEQFVDMEQIEKDSQFKCYTIPEQERQGFNILPLHKLPVQVLKNAWESCKEFACILTRGYDKVGYNNYILCIGYKCQQNTTLTEVKSKDYKELNNFEELGDYIGAPIFYSGGWYEKPQFGCITGFSKHQRSSKMLSIGSFSNGGSSTTFLHENSVDWIGIVRYVGPNYFEEKKMLHAFDYLPDKNYFEIDSGKAILSDPCNDRNWINVILPNVKKGKWFYKINDDSGSVEQLLAYHESITLSKEEEFAIPKELYSYWENDVGNPVEGEDSKQITQILRNNVYSIHSYPTLPQWHKVWVGVGVDTARAGIFDEKYYYDESVAPKYKEGQTGWLKHFQEGFSDSAWQKMVDEKMENTNVTDIPFGVVSSTGYGDGTYQSLVKIDPPSKEIVAIRIVYISNLN